MIHDILYIYFFKCDIWYTIWNDLWKGLLDQKRFWFGEGFSLDCINIMLSMDLSCEGMIWILITILLKSLAVWGDQFGLFHVMLSHGFVAMGSSREVRGE